MSLARRWKALPAALAALAVFVVLARLYADPLLPTLLSGTTEAMVGDGTDPTATPFHYGILLQTLREHPSWLLYGSVYTDHIDPPAGFGLWVPWSERLFVVLAGGLLALEQLPTAFVLVLFALDAALFYLFGRLMGWSRLVSLALAMCWAFNPFTRARAGVHLALAGTYFLPAAFAALLLLRRGVTPRRVAGAAALLLLAASAAHYYVITLLVLAPLLALFLLGGAEGRAGLRRLVPGVLVAAAPALLLLGWSVLRPVPSEVAARAGRSFVPPPKDVEYFLETFGSRPIDFFTSDLKFSPVDWNPWRERLNLHVVTTLGEGNPHERTNGVRWGLYLLALGGLALVLPVRGGEGAQSRQRFAFFLVLALVGALLALAPSYLGVSRWVSRLVPNFRVPSRFGPYAHFGLLACAGLTLTALGARRFLPRLPGAARPALASVLLGALVLEYWPSTPLPLQRLLPRRGALAEGRAECGTGMFFPYYSHVEPYAMMVAYYGLQQQLRGTGCRLLNRNGPSEDDVPLRQAFGLTAVQARARNDPALLLEQLSEFTRCSQLTWLAFAAQVPEAWVRRTCQALDWEVLPGRQCRSRDGVAPPPSPERLARCLPPR